jgi:hypothetical protein
MTKEEKKKKLRKFMALYQIRLKDQNLDDLPEWGTPFIPERDDEEREDFICSGELNFEQGETNHELTRK